MATNGLGAAPLRACSHMSVQVLFDIDTCPTHYGRLNKFGDAGHMLERVHNMTVPVEKAAKMTEEELEGKFVTGVLVNRQREDYYTRYQQIIDRLATGQQS